MAKRSAAGKRMAAAATWSRLEAFGTRTMPLARPGPSQWAKR